MKLFNRLAIFVAALLLPQVGIANQTVQLYTVDYPPYSLIDEKGAISGIDVEVTQAAFAAVGINADIQTAPWKRILKSIRHGRMAGTVTCSKRAGRDQFILFSDVLSEANQSAVMRLDRSDDDIVNFEDLREVSVSVVDGWGIQKELQQAGIAHSVVPDVDSGIRSLIYRNVDVFYNAGLVTNYRARKLGLQDEIKIKRLKGMHSTQYHLCLSKAYPKAEVLLEKFNEGLRLIKSNGQYQAIYDRYL
ncbi:transporter substrate-binding domain-containing protein [Neptuniibacter sp. QD37_11]|uniref:transporter substrate-binding domain-containing protein n=1 Tax=Neptuniibacter sp. QD37_11 TaxID=3398209 RepID=UPI0039F58E94